MTRLERRALATLAAAVLAPLVLFATLQAAFAMQSLRGEVERDALSRAREINAAADGLILADQSALEVLSSSRLFAAHDLPGARGRAAEVQRTRPRWRNVILTDRASGQVIWETRPDVAGANRGALGDFGDGAIGQLAGARPACPCLTITARVHEGPATPYQLTAVLGSEDFQKIVLSHAAPGGVTALVDRQGRFIARSLDYETKRGLPATHFVRDAIVRARHGLYQGVTYEGLKNFTAFETSDLTGWSAHVAINADKLRGPRLASLALISAAGFGSLLLAAAIAALALRQVRARRAELERSAQSQKLEAVGQLASGVAHDFNNLLMVIDGNLKRISTRATDPALRKPIDNALAASERGARLVSQLMAFTRSQPLEIGVVDLGELLEGLQGLLQQSVGPLVAVSVELAPDARRVVSNAGQLEMALLNLAVNARDAMPAGGLLSVRTRLSAEAPGMAELTVADTGEGMSRETADRAMEPFFTTKPVGKGTGLGLSQVFGIVSQSGGLVHIDSAPGAGTTVTLRLPLAPAAGGPEDLQPGVP